MSCPNWPASRIGKLEKNTCSKATDLFRAKLRKAVYACVACIVLPVHAVSLHPILDRLLLVCNTCKIGIYGFGYACIVKGCTDCAAQIGMLRRLLRVATQECSAKQAQRWDRTELLQMSCRSHCLGSEEFDYMHIICKNILLDRLPLSCMRRSLAHLMYKWQSRFIEPCCSK